MLLSRLEAIKTPADYLLAVVPALQIRLESVSLLNI